MTEYRMCWSHTQNGVGMVSGCGPWGKRRSRIRAAVAFGNAHHGTGSHWMETRTEADQ